MAMQDFKKRYGKKWQEIIEKTIQESSEIFEKEFGIKLVLKEIEIKNHQFRSLVPFSVFNYSNLINKNDSAKFDATLIFTNEPWFFLHDQTISGIVDFPTRFILLANAWSLTLLLIHELGHILGAKHVEDEKSYMGPGWVHHEFDTANKSIILKNKWKNFKSAH